MNFAEKWLRYLDDKGRMIQSLALIGSRTEKTPYTEISVGGDEVKQRYPVGDRMEIPEYIRFDSIKVKRVEVTTDGPLKFIIDSKKNIEVVHMEMLSDEEKTTMERDANQLEYKITKFEQSDVL